MVYWERKQANRFCGGNPKCFSISAPFLVQLKLQDRVAGWLLVLQIRPARSGQKNGPKYRALKCFDKNKHLLTQSKIQRTSKPGHGPGQPPLSAPAWAGCWTSKVPAILHHSGVLCILYWICLTEAHKDVFEEIKVLRIFRKCPALGTITETAASGMNWSG